MTAATITAAVLSLISAVAAGWFGLRSSTRAKQIEAESAPYQQLADRVSALERRVDILLSEQWTDRTYVRRLIAVWPPDKPLPIPMPPWLAEHYGLSPQHPPTPGSIIEPPQRPSTPPRRKP